MTIEELFNRVPPGLCRFLARKHRGFSPMSNLEIAQAGGLACSTVARLSSLRTWDGVKLATIEKFTRGCGVNILSFSSQKKFLNRRKLFYLSKGYHQQRRMYDRLLCELSQSALRS